MWRGMRSCLCVARGNRCNAVWHYRVGPYRMSNVLQVLLAKIRKFDRNLAADLIVGGRRDADAARFGDPFKPRRDIDAVAKNIVVLYQNIAQIDSDPEQHLP